VANGFCCCSRVDLVDALRPELECQPTRVLSGLRAVRYGKRWWLFAKPAHQSDNNNDKAHYMFAAVDSIPATVLQPLLGIPYLNPAAAFWAYLTALGAWRCFLGP